MTKFDPNKHMSNLRGKDYLEVKWRLVWFREEHPDWGIETQIVNSAPGAVQMKATIKNDKGVIVSQAHKAERSSNFSDYLEKAETGAIGRALAHIGYGTQFAGEDVDEGMEKQRLADAPVKKTTSTKNLIETEIN